MAELPQAVVGTDFRFHSDHRVHLESKTYYSLLQIFTHCYGDSPLSSAPPIFPPPSSSESNGGDRGLSDGGGGGGENRVSGGLDFSERREPEDSMGREGVALDGGVKDVAGGEGVFDARQRMIDELEQIMQREDNGSGLMVDNRTEGSGSGERDISREQILMNELQDVMVGSEEWFSDGGPNLAGAVLEDKQGDDGVSGLLKKGDEFDDSQQNAEEETEGAGQVQSEEEERRLEAAETEISPLEIGGIGVLKTSGNCEQGSSNQHKEMGSEKPASSHHMAPSTSEMIESQDLEEGEISGDCLAGDHSADMLANDAILSQRSNADKSQLSNELTNGNESSSNQEDGSKRKSVELPAVHGVHDTSNSKTIKFDESILNKLVDGDDEVSGNICGWSKESEVNLDQTGNKRKQAASTERDDNVSKRRKRGPAKEQKRAKERKKRAKMRRELGLDRVKVKPILKPKTVTYCRHYLVGRCHEGDKCKFSHDAVPLTKSKPCRYFARNLCMKGDDCPFDHLLSKYSCDNYISKGFCSRGDGCLFSHQVPREEGASSLLQHEKPELKSPMPSSVDNKQQQNVFETPHKMVSKEQNAKETPAKELFSSKSPMANASRTVQRKLPPRRTQSSATGNVTSEGALGTTKNIESPKGSVVTKMVAAPAGINFLSFSKGPSTVSSGKSLASLILSDGDGSKQHSNENGNASQAMSSTSSRDQNLTQPRKESPLAVAPPGLSFLYFGKDLADDSMCRGQAGVPSSVKNGHLQENRCASDQQHKPSAISRELNGTLSDSCGFSEQHKSATGSTHIALDSSCSIKRKLEKDKNAEESQHAPDKQFTSTTPWKLAVNPSATGQSSEQLTRKTISNLRGNTVMSTLSWASSFNSKPVSHPVVCSGATAGGGESSTAVESKSVKVSKILDFLSSIGSKTKH